MANNPFRFLTLEEIEALDYEEQIDYLFEEMNFIIDHDYNPPRDAEEENEEEEEKDISNDPPSSTCKVESRKRRREDDEEPPPGACPLLLMPSTILAK